VLPRSGWRVDYLGTTTYQANLSSEALANMPRLCGRQDIADRMAPLRDQLGVIAPLLENHLIHMPFWAVAPPASISLPLPRFDLNRGCAATLQRKVALRPIRFFRRIVNG
jgi:hypothetical protein